MEVGNWPGSLLTTRKAVVSPNCRSSSSCAVDLRPRDDEATFAAIVRPHLDHLVSTARVMLGSDDLAGDAVQETLLTLWRQTDLPHNLRSWLLRVVTKRSLHLLRTLSRRRRHEERACSYHAETCSRDEPSQVIANEELRSQLEQALAELPEDQRMVFVLCEIEHLDYEEISQLLQIPLGTVRSRLHRARQALRKNLERKLAEEECWFCRAKGESAKPCPPNHRSLDN